MTMKEDKPFWLVIVLITVIVGYTPAKSWIEQNNAPEPEPPTIKIIDSPTETPTNVVPAKPESLFDYEPEPVEEEYLCEGYPTVCEDRSCSNSTGSGTCSHHDGVWYYN